MLLPCTPPDSDPPAIIQWYKDGHLLNISDPSQVKKRVNELAVYFTVLRIHDILVWIRILFFSSLTLKM
jgi:hypothetical protein